jgi:hypothetical protein
MKLLLLGAALIGVLDMNASVIPADVFGMLLCLSVLVVVQGGKEVLQQGRVA